MKKYKVGYTQGTFDMFHIGHLNLLIRAKEQCDYLIVGVNSDALVMEYKNKAAIIHENERLAIVQNLKVVDKCVLSYTLDKIEIYKKEHFDAIFIGSDWQDNERWKKTKDTFACFGVEVVFLPYTEGISSTFLRDKHTKAIEE